MSERKPYRGGIEFLPLLENRILEYRESADGEETIYELKFHYIGGREWKVYTVTGDNSPYGGFELQSDGVLVEAVSNLSYTSLEPRDEVAEYAQVWVDDGAEVDSAWIDPTPGTETIVAGFETVSVPAGRFEECLKTVVTPLPEVKDSVEARYARGALNEDQYLREREYAAWQTVRWFAAEIGLVKEQLGPPGQARIVRELLAVKSEGVGLVDSLFLKPNP